MMIKHQEELIDVTGTQCPLHGMKYNKVLSENDSNENLKKQSSDYDNDTSINNADCLCEEDIIKKDYFPY